MLYLALLWQAHKSLVASLIQSQELKIRGGTCVVKQCFMTAVAWGEQCIFGWGDCAVPTKKGGGSRFDVNWKAFSKAPPEFSLFCTWLRTRIWYKFFTQMPRSPEFPLHQPSWSSGPWGPGKWKIKMSDAVGPEIHQLLNLLDRDFLF